MKTEDAMLLLAGAVWLGIALLLVGLMVKSNVLLACGAILPLAGGSGFLVLRYLDLYRAFELLPVLRRINELRAVVREKNKWFVTFVNEHGNREVEKKAGDMFAFMKRYLKTSVRTPDFKVLVLVESDWEEFYGKWVNPNNDKSKTFRLDRGTRISADLSSWLFLFGMCLRTKSPFHEFPFDFVIFLNLSLIQKRAKSEALLSGLSVDAVQSHITDDVLMHEVVHMLEGVLARSLMTGYVPGSRQDPFVVEVYNAHKSRMEAKM
jgi:hypothetical protein